ncbi:hydrolase [Palaeococcus pacificus DY20341]|uniref:Hydrolase n=1 Tax=Palaeococcus pacificus DY20341 TaxID=1343739 RepID=A0A075LU27_9EURY|nr:HAD family hydrolase [Palaeococcus pacificus]AIF70220.1 hydrolase [Palaeococcus pacificus DY20341]
MLVLVDLDDTLCNTWEAAKYSVLRLLPHLLKKRKIRALIYILTQRYKELEQSKELHILDLDKLLEQFMERVYRKVSEKDLDEMLDLVDRTFFSNLKLYPDAKDFLEGLREMGAKIVLITDSSSYWQRKKLEYLDIKDYFDALIISGETGISKLDPHNFFLAKKMFPREDEIYMVGDRDETDMKGGKTIGATTILVKRGYFQARRPEYADYIVGDLREALEVIKREHEKRA